MNEVRRWCFVVYTAFAYNISKDTFLAKQIGTTSCFYNSSVITINTHESNVIEIRLDIANNNTFNNYKISNWHHLSVSHLRKLPETKDS